MDESELVKRVKQMELDEALAASLAYKEQQRERARETHQTPEVPLKNSEEETEDDSESGDLFEEIAEGFDKTMDDVSKKADEFADGEIYYISYVFCNILKDVSKAWAGLTRRISQKYNETFNSASDGRSPCVA